MVCGGKELKEVYVGSNLMDLIFDTAKGVLIPILIGFLWIWDDWEFFYDRI